MVDKFLRISEHLNIDRAVLLNNGIVDIFINIDNPFYIHPILIENSSIVEFVNSKDKISNKFNMTISLIKRHLEDGKSTKTLKIIRKYFTFKEEAYFALGNSTKNRNGNGLTGKTRDDAIDKLIDYVELGVDDVELINAIGVFSENIGVDRQSDMICHIVKEDLLTYTNRMVNEIGIEKTHNFEFNIDGEIKNFILPYRDDGTPIVLFPEEILSDIPFVSSFTDIADAIYANQQVKDYLHNKFTKVTKTNFITMTKTEFHEMAKSNIEIINQVIKQVTDKVISSYDFSEDNIGFYSLFDSMANFMRNETIEVSKTELNKTLFENIRLIINKYKFLIENRGQWKELYNVDGTRRHERTSHSMLIFLLEPYTDIFDFSYEWEKYYGDGYVDFRFSKNREVVLLEVKLSSNYKIKEGYTKQLNRYLEQEPTDYGYYVIIEVESEGLSRFYKGGITKIKEAEIISINGKQRPSPSQL